ncbi:MAG TPA: hypothetical protein VJ757_01545, partial [Pseudonocardiaceae bacterium]|nr:hypothetical protein [Pseudonocardiaceae bacterium]
RRARLADHGCVRVLTGDIQRATEIRLLPVGKTSVEAHDQLGEWDSGGRTTSALQATASRWALL